MTDLHRHACRTSDDYLATRLNRLADTPFAVSMVEQALLRAAAQRLGEDTFPGRCRLEFRPTSKDALIKRLYPGVTVDAAVPSAWVERIYKVMPGKVVDQITQPEGIAFHFCTVYDAQGSSVRPLTRQGVDLLSEFVNYVR